MSRKRGGFIDPAIQSCAFCGYIENHTDFTHYRVLVVGPNVAICSHCALAAVEQTLSAMEESVKRQFGATPIATPKPPMKKRRVAR